MAVVPGLKPALFFRAPGRSVLKGWAVVRVCVPGDTRDKVLPGSVQWRGLQSFRVHLALFYPGFFQSFVVFLGRRTCQLQVFS